MAKSKCQYVVYDVYGDVKKRTQRIGPAMQAARTLSEGESSRYLVTAVVERQCATRTHRKDTEVFHCRAGRCTKRRQRQLRFRTGFRR